MKMRTIMSVTIVIAVVCMAVAVVWGEITAQDVKRIAAVLRPYQVLNGQTATTDFEVIYVLDNESKKLAVLRYDSVKQQLLPIAGRYLATDFGSESVGPFTMVSTQLSGRTGLLYVVDASTRRAIVYQVDVNQNKNTITPQQPTELRKLFND